MTTSTADARGRPELAAAWRASRCLMGFAVLCSVIVNLLALTGPLYMLQIVDRVMASRSEETLVALSILAAFLFLCMGLLDHVRSRIMTVVGARFQDRLDRRVFEAATARSLVSPGDPAALSAQRDLEAVQRFLSSPLILACFDIPWGLLFVGAIFVFHPALGWVAVAGASVLILIAAMNRWLTDPPQARASAASVRSARQADRMKDEAEALKALGMTRAAFDRWQALRRSALAGGLSVAGVSGALAAASRAVRSFLQSAILGVGAWLALHGDVSAGAVMATSILLGRGLAPIEKVVGHWAIAQSAREAWDRLGGLLADTPAEVSRTGLPRPAARFEVADLTIAPPGGRGACLRNVSFTLAPGQAIGVVGPTGSGKSTLARALTGIWQPAGGTIRLGGAAICQYGSDMLGRCIGYLPQRVGLFEGTVAENIARLQMPPDSRKVVEAATLAGAHEMILGLPDGYDTCVGAGGGLSGGQVQRIALARALFGDPLLLVLDEPDSNLDSEGTAALTAAIRSMKRRGCAILVMAHRPAVIEECDLLLVVEDGRQRAFGPRDPVLRGLAGGRTGPLRTVQARGAV